MARRNKATEMTFPPTEPSGPPEKGPLTHCSAGRRCWLSTRKWEAVVVGLVDWTQSVSFDCQQTFLVLVIGLRPVHTTPL